VGDLVYMPKRGNKETRARRHELECALAERDGDGCFYCEAGGPLTVDHVRARAAGGSDAFDNLVLACLDCNWLKSSAAAWFYVVKRELGVAA
jgi:5-methylcytosine-specific restriction endonuclease McrA